MAKKAGFGVLEFGSTPTVVGELRSWNVNQEAAERDTTIMGAGQQRVEPGSVSNRIEGTVYYEDPDDAGQALIRTNVGSETTQLVSLYPFGNTTGKAVLSGQAYVMRFNTSGPEGADGSVEADFLFTADAAGFTWGTVP